MELIRDLSLLNNSHRPSVVSIGNYDGVHLGHQSVIQPLLEKSRELDAPATIITFSPLAKEYFAPDSIVHLSTVEQRAEWLFELGVERVLCIPFTDDFANFSRQRFVSEVLAVALGAKFVSVGDDFRFGYKREGDFEFLKCAGEKFGFEVRSQFTFELKGERVSSGRIRELVLDGEFDTAQELLGRPFTISGRVSKGDQLGRTIGYPTANIVLPVDFRSPVNGVYAVQFQLNEEDDQKASTVLNAVANVGVRPTVGGSEPRIEVHIFDFDEQIYGRKASVFFKAKIRDEQRFDSVEELKRQIEIDSETARQKLLGN
jgi:riboflavin kinase/FMN adenylyltransferase